VPGSGRRELASWIVGAAVLAVAFAFIWLGDSELPPPLGRGVPAPDFDVALLDPEPTTERFVLSKHRGRFVLVNFWATWCKPCEDEMPSMQQLYDQLGRDDFDLVAISVDVASEEVAAFRDRMGIRFPIGLDPSQQVSRLYQTTGYPESLLIDRAGIVVERYVGPRDWSVYVGRIRERMASAR